MNSKHGVTSPAQAEDRNGIRTGIGTPGRTAFRPSKGLSGRPVALLLPALIALLLTGCLPSCQPRQSNALFPSDSLSRQIAAETPVGTLRLVWQAGTAEVPGMEHPRTALFGPDGRLYVSDTAQDRIFVFGPDGSLSEELALPAFQHPYLAGFRADTLLVFNPAAGRIDFVSQGAVRRTIDLPVRAPEGAFQYVAVSDSAVYLKTIAEGEEGSLVVLDEGGKVLRTEILEGPYWRYAGGLRVQDDTLYSLSGYRPVVDVLAPGAPLDTLALVGFDSPMLARSRQFVLGQVDEAPLLTASAVPVGDSLFVLNVRPGWLRVDVYDRQGRLRRILTQENPEFDRAFYPMDLAVRQSGPGIYDFAVISAGGDLPRVWLHRWRSQDNP